MQCLYCFQPWKPSEKNEKLCHYCGAAKPEQDYQKSDPFFYEGYIVWCVRSMSYAWFEFVFYKGTTYIGMVRWDWKKMNQYAENIDVMPFVLKELEFDLGITNVPVIELTPMNRIHFVADFHRLFTLDREGIAKEIETMIEKAFGSM